MALRNSINIEIRGGMIGGSRGAILYLARRIAPIGFVHFQVQDISHIGQGFNLGIAECPVIYHHLIHSAR